MNTVTNTDMTRFFIVAILVALVTAPHANAASPFLTTGHREAMMANGGNTDLCSSGQFALNPAGIFCPAKAGYSESFGSANLSASNSSTRQGGVSEMGAGLRTSPGLSLFSQGIFSESSVFGFWAVLNPTSASRSFALTQSQLEGVIEFDSVQSETSLGPFFAGKYQETYWGVAVSLTQTESKFQSVSKFTTPGGDTMVGNTKSNTLEQLLSSRAGLIWDLGNLRYAATVTTPAYSLKGAMRSDSTTIGTSNTFTEQTKKGSVRTTDSGSLVLALQLAANPLQKWGFDLSYTGSAKVESEQADVGESSPPVASLGANFQKVFTEKISFLAGLRHGRTLGENDRKFATDTSIASLGILRRYKGVELGSGFAYSHVLMESSDPKNGSSTTMDRFDVTFSSTFTY